MDAALRDRIAARAANQHGVITRDQLRHLGLTVHQIGHLVRSGRLHAVSQRVFVLPGAPEDWAQRAFVAVAETHGIGALSHHARRRIGASRVSAETASTYSSHVALSITARPGRRAVHTTRRLPDHHVVELDGIRVTSPVRTVFDLSDVLPLGRLARLLDDAWGLKLLKADSLYETLEELRGRGRGRVAWMRMLIEERGREYSAPESGLERRFRRLLEKDGQPPMEYQVDLGGEEWIARVDAVDRQAKVVVQIDSDRFHTSLLDRRHDEQQDAALRALGWTVIRITETDLRRRPAWVIAIVRTARSGLAAPAAQAEPVHDPNWWGTAAPGANHSPPVRLYAATGGRRL